MRIAMFALALSLAFAGTSLSAELPLSPSTAVPAVSQLTPLTCDQTQALPWLVEDFRTQYQHCDSAVQECIDACEGGGDGLPPQSCVVYLHLLLES